MNKCYLCKTTEKPTTKKLMYYANSVPIYYYACNECEKERWLKHKEDLHASDLRKEPPIDA